MGRLPEMDNFDDLEPEQPNPGWPLDEAITACQLVDEMLDHGESVDAVNAARELIEEHIPRQNQKSNALRGLSSKQGNFIAGLGFFLKAVAHHRNFVEARQDFGQAAFHFKEAGYGHGVNFSALGFRLVGGERIAAESLTIGSSYRDPKEAHELNGALYRLLEKHLTSRPRP